MAEDFGTASELFDAVHQGQRTWMDRLSEREREWFEWLADLTEERKRLPSWKAVSINYKRNFPEGKLPSQKTVSRHLRRHLRETGRGEWLPDE